MTEIYLDNAATTPVLDEVVETMSSSLKNNYFNPSAEYRPAKETRQSVNDARKTIADSLYTSPEEIYFTGSATEANNTIIRGTVERSHGDFNIITSSIEHPSVMEVFNYFKNKGVDVRFIPVDEFGNLDLDWLRENIDEKTKLVSVMAVNNEIGSISNLREIKKILKKNNPDTLFHTDYVQAFLKTKDKRVDLRRLDPDAVTITAHKVNGPKGIGAMKIKRNSKIAPLLLGGGQERSFRSGTENVPGILGFSAAVDYHRKKIKDNENYLADLKKYAINNFKEIPDLIINSPEDGISNLLSIAALGTKAEVLLHMLSDKGIYLAAGSACSTKHKNSYVHDALGYDKLRSDGTIRISMSENNTKEDIDILTEELKTGISDIRKVMAYH